LAKVTTRQYSIYYTTNCSISSNIANKA